MPRIHERNPRHRSKERLCEDIALILCKDFSYGTKFAVLTDATWVWTEFNGKYAGCDYWSEAAWALGSKSKDLVHEHVVPKSKLIGELIKLEHPTATEVRELMDSYCIGAVITKEEDALLNQKGLRSKMPDGWNWHEKDVWARYTTAGISMRARSA